MKGAAMDTTHTETTPIAGIVHGLLIMAVPVAWLALHLNGYGEYGAGLAAFVVVGWCLVWLQRYTEQAQPDPEEPLHYESHQVLRMQLPCGVCGRLRLIEDLRPHDVHYRICRDGLCRRRDLDEQEIA